MLRFFILCSTLPFVYCRILTDCRNETLINSNNEILEESTSIKLLETYNGLYEACKKYQNLLINSKCDAIDKILIDKKCTLAKLMTSGFDTNCYKKLKIADSKCFNDYLYRNKRPFIIMPPKSSEYLTDYCSNLLGENNCLKPLILELCGSENWIDLEKNFLKYDNYCGE
ncbi:unnamed protein product [Caenorhabditis angaria]|uniref:T20D4.11-like domain-containing protein n=1 Tax=Caenorhabditis angaria TaxID=860376 RepID=A0A9P1IZ70_9PELO|nr:unnamed protein product [Caenorhabditis angaria]